MITQSRFFRANGYEIHVGVLDLAALETLRQLPLSVYNSRPINGEGARRQRPFETNRRAHAPVLRCLDAFLGGCNLLAFEPSVLMSMSDAERQRR